MPTLVQHLLFFLLLLPFGAFAQQGNIWAFGNNAALDFNSGSPVVLSGFAMTALEGCASIADNNGNLIFYTDGDSVWDKNHALMPNGFGLLGDPSSTQSAIIAPQPGNPNKYYIFTVDAIENQLAAGLNFSEVDLTLNGGLGDVVSATKNFLLVDTVAEKVTAIAHGNGTDIWVISHEIDNNRYVAFLIDATGVNTTPIISDVGEIHPLAGSGSRGYLKASSQGDKIGIAMVGSTNDGVNNIEILDFDNATGLISNPQSWEPTFNSSYGVEFSPNGQFLYISSWSTGGLHQYDISSGVAATIAATDVQLGMNNIGALQLAPDQKIYAAIFNGDLGVINSPNLQGVAADYVTGFLNVAPGTVQLGLPTFIQSFFVTANFNTTGLCLGDSTFFSADTAGVNSVLWSFGDPASGTADTSTSFDPFHIYPDTGTYPVTLIAIGDSTVDTATINIFINPVPQVDLGNDTSLCNGQTLILNAFIPTMSYVWQDNSTDSNFTVTSNGLYKVTVSNVCGTVEDSIQVQFDDTLVFSLGPDTVLCEGDTYTIDPNITVTASYLWQDNSTGPTFVATSSDTVILNATNGCGTITDTANVLFIPLPDATLPVDTFICNDIELILNTAGEDSVNYVWQDSTTVGFQEIDTTGTYWLAAFNSCGFSIDTFNVTFFPPIVTDLGFDTTICNEDSLELIATSPLATSYLWSTGSVDTSIFVSQAGNYVVTVTSGLCTLVDAIEIITNRTTCFDGIDCAIIAPNVFTPNNDGFNDEFYVTSNCEFEGYLLTVYNRWGLKVFESNTPNLGWDGAAEGLQMPNGVYYWIIEYQHDVVVDVDRTEQAGSVSLMR